MRPRAARRFPGQDEEEGVALAALLDDRRPAGTSPLGVPGTIWRSRFEQAVNSGTAASPEPDPAGMPDRIHIAAEV